MKTLLLGTEFELVGLLLDELVLDHFGSPSGFTFVSLTSKSFLPQWGVPHRERAPSSEGRMP